MLDAAIKTPVLDAFYTIRQQRPDEPVFIMVDQHGNDQDTLTYAELDEKSDQLAALLYNAGHRRGERAIQLYRASSDFVVALLACLKLGLASVPLALPRTRTEADIDLFVKV